MARGDRRTGVVLRPGNRAYIREMNREARERAESEAPDARGQRRSERQFKRKAVSQARTTLKAYGKLPRDDPPRAAGPAKTATRKAPPRPDAYTGGGTRRGRSTNPPISGGSGTRAKSRAGSPPLGLVPLPRAARRALQRTPRRRALLTEFLVAETIVAVSELTKGSPPSPGKFLSPLFVYFVLAIIADFGPQASRFAVALGALVLLAIALSHSAGIIAAAEAVGAVATI